MNVTELQNFFNNHPIRFRYFKGFQIPEVNFVDMPFKWQLDPPFRDKAFNDRPGYSWRCKFPLPGIPEYQFVLFYVCRAEEFSGFGYYDCYCNVGTFNVFGYNPAKVDSNGHYIRNGRDWIKDCPTARIANERTRQILARSTEWKHIESLLPESLTEEDKDLIHNLVMSKVIPHRFLPETYYISEEERPEYHGAYTEDDEFLEDLASVYDEVIQEVLRKHLEAQNSEQ
jgi:hypothetical protein